MAWAFKFTDKAAKQLRKLGKQAQRDIIAHLEHIASLDNPKLQGKALSANYAGLWRYRVGDYRLICQIKDAELLVLILKVGHRKDVYR